MRLSHALILATVPLLLSSCAKLYGGPVNIDLSISPDKPLQLSLNAGTNPIKIEQSMKGGDLILRIYESTEKWKPPAGKPGQVRSMMAIPSVMYVYVDFPNNWIRAGEEKTIRIFTAKGEGSCQVAKGKYTLLLTCPQNDVVNVVKSRITNFPSDVKELGLRASGKDLGYAPSFKDVQKQLTTFASQHGLMLATDVYPELPTPLRTGFDATGFNNYIFVIPKEPSAFTGSTIELNGKQYRIDLFGIPNPYWERV